MLWPQVSLCTKLHQVVVLGAGVVDHVMELHHRSQHIVQQVSVGDSVYDLPTLLQPTGREVSSMHMLSSEGAAIHLGV